jgi:hypothetical protein
LADIGAIELGGNFWQLEQEFSQAFLWGEHAEHFDDIWMTPSGNAGARIF